MKLLLIIFSGAIYVLTVYGILSFVSVVSSDKLREYTVSIASLIIIAVTAKFISKIKI